MAQYSDFEDKSIPRKKRSTPTEALAKIYRYCAYQERAHQEVRSRLFEYGLSADEVEQILTKLITDGFLNEERFAKAFAGGKFRMKKWGRLKIENELASLGVSPKCIARGLSEIDPSDYLKTLHDVLHKKNDSLDETNAFVRRDKLAKYAISRGFEPDLVWTEVKSMVRG